MSSENVARVELIKVPTPSKPADTMAGSSVPRWRNPSSRSSQPRKTVAQLIEFNHGSSAITSRMFGVAAAGSGTALRFGQSRGNEQEQWNFSHCGSIAGGVILGSARKNGR
jgi:hypothetical protein